ncbi:MAG: hypothetical protein KDB90_10920 [Planctomycetes bacterium]|nr:hypothetical protein [Planctomycetota bacterium]
MTRTSSLLLILLLAGCTTRTWTETTETTRPVGPTTESVKTMPVADEFVQLRTDTEKDSFTVREDFTTNADGKLEIELLTPALQCLMYGHDITMQLWSYTQEKVIYSRNLNEADAVDVVREWSVQARLGTEVPLRGRVAKILDELIEKTEDKAVRDQLDAIRTKVRIRLEWE